MEWRHGQFARSEVRPENSKIGSQEEGQFREQKGDPQPHYSDKSDYIKIKLCNSGITKKLWELTKCADERRSRGQSCLTNTKREQKE